jgi:formylglycine-generating enzyme required for sulfatase activity
VVVLPTLGEKEAKKVQEDSATKLKLPLEIKNSVGMKMRLIPAGKFVAANPNQNELDKLEVKAPFYLGIYEVTQDEYEKVMAENPSQFKGPRLPVENVTWEEAVKYCNKLSEKEGMKPYYDAKGKVLGGVGYRLPGEEEWEWACRAGTGTQYVSGDNEAALGDYAWFSLNSGNQTHPVGGKKANAFGLYDMHGNVWEWCEEIYTAPSYKGPVSRVYRGGSWISTGAFCRSAIRFARFPASRINILGFRLAQAPSAEHK